MTPHPTAAFSMRMNSVTGAVLCIINLVIIEGPEREGHTTLLNDIQLSDYKRKWNFVFMMVPDLPAALTKGKEDVYVGWWYKNKVYTPGVIPPSDVAAYVHAYAREGRMDAAFDYCRNIVVDMEFNKKQFSGKLPIPLLAVGG